MTPSTATNPYKHHRVPGEIISHAVWLSLRFPLSHRDGKNSCSFVGSSCRTQPSATGAACAGSSMRINAVAGVPSKATRGPWTRCW
jgi:hypothetical protein